VFERSLTWLAIALSLIIIAGFSLYALEDIGRASEKSEQRITGGFTAASPSPAGERERERRHGQVREFIDDSNDVLLSPFAGVSENAKSGWTRRGVPALIGLAIYGFGLGYIARFMTARGGSPRAAAAR